MTARLDHHAIQNGVDAAFEFGGLLIRAAGYSLLCAAAHGYDVGKPLLAGALTADLASHALLVFLRWHHGLQTVLAEFALLAVIAFFARDQFHWPEDLAMRAIWFLAALGVLAGKFVPSSRE